jgi:membrane-associated phospholipid phosphatase
MHRYCLLLFLVSFFKFLPACAQETSPVPVSFSVRDSVPEPQRPAFDSPVPGSLFAPIQSRPVSLRSVLIPSAMIGYGAFAIGSRELKKVNEEVQQAVWAKRNTISSIPFEDYSLMAPAAAVYALNMVGVKGKNNFVDRSFIYGISNLIGTGITSSVKRLSGVMRPDSSNRLSFPSGHTSKAFIAAEFLRQEYRHRSPWYGVAGYAVAVGTGFLRMYNNKHWLNDVVAGAGVGILSTRISYWLYPKMKAAFFPKSKTQTVVVPTYQAGAVGVGVVHSF